MIRCLVLLVCLWAGDARAETTLLNVSYDATREMYAEINRAFAAQSAAPVRVRTAHGGSGGQARAVMDGLAADVVTLALPPDIDAVAKAGLIAPGWASRLPGGAVPFTSTILFVVRAGNPKHIRDWPDLVRPGVAVVTANPKISGGARWAYMAAWAYASQAGQDPQAFMTALYRNVPILDSGARGSTITFAQRGQGDVLLAWEDEAALAQKQRPGLEVVVPSLSIRAEPPVAVVDRVVDRRGTRALAEAYAAYLFTEPAQQIAAQHNLRPTDPAVLAANTTRFPALKLVTIAELGGWAAVQSRHFAEGGVFDQLFQPGSKP